jgi:hypothetical protein
MRPNSHLKQLIARASSEEQARAMAKAREYLLMCRRLAIDPLPAERIYGEALEIVMEGPEQPTDPMAKDRFYTSRSFSRNYSEQ